MGINKTQHRISLRGLLRQQQMQTSFDLDKKSLVLNAYVLEIEHKRYASAMNIAKHFELGDDKVRNSGNRLYDVLMAKGNYANAAEVALESGMDKDKAKIAAEKAFDQKLAEISGPHSEKSYSERLYEDLADFAVKFGLGPSKKNIAILKAVDILITSKRDYIRAAKLLNKNEEIRDDAMPLVFSEYKRALSAGEYAVAIMIRDAFNIQSGPLVREIELDAFVEQLSYDMSQSYLEYTMEKFDITANEKAVCALRAIEIADVQKHNPLLAAKIARITDQDEKIVNQHAQRAFDQAVVKKDYDAIIAISSEFSEFNVGNPEYVKTVFNELISKKNYGKAADIAKACGLGKTLEHDAAMRAFDAILSSGYFDSVEKARNLIKNHDLSSEETMPVIQKAVEHNKSIGNYDRAARLAKGLGMGVDVVKALGEEVFNDQMIMARYADAARSALNFGLGEDLVEMANKLAEFQNLK